ncbi:hypothetical protein T484DRAFT_1859010 [Baffinella frigidus]|nr:hypothetical protein T484DRAFT_1859010 [Cryptophyta sp. CCMP2293]
MEVYAALLWLQMKQLTYDLQELVDGLPDHHICRISLCGLSLAVISIAVLMLLEYVKQTWFIIAIFIAYTIHAMDTHNKLFQKLLDTEDELSKTKDELLKTKDELSKTKDELSKTKDELSETYRELRDTIMHAEISDLYSELSSTMYDFGATMASLVEEHPTIVLELQRIEVYTKELKSEIISLERRVEEQKHESISAMDRQTVLEEKLTKQKLMELETLEKKLADKDVLIGFLMTRKTPYWLIFICIVMGMVLGVGTNVTAYIGYEIIITALYIVRQVILALVYVLQIKDVVIEYLTTSSVFDYLLIFIWIVMGMVLGVFHELATNVTAYIGYEIIITAMYIVRQVILALVYVLQMCL